MSDSAPPPPPPEPPAGNTPPPPPPPPAAAAPPPPMPAAAPPPPAAALGPQPGTLLDRFLARFIDGIIVGIVSVIIGVILGASIGGFTASAISAVITAVIYLGYFAYLESSRGQTIGKQVMKLHVVGPDGVSVPTMEQAVRRNVWTGFGILGVVPILGSLIGALGELVAVIVIAVTINNDTVRRQSWFDVFAGGTQVLKRP